MTTLRIRKTKNASLMSNLFRVYCWNQTGLGRHFISVLFFFFLNGHRIGDIIKILHILYISPFILGLAWQLCLKAAEVQTEPNTSEGLMCPLNNLCTCRINSYADYVLVIIVSCTCQWDKQGTAKLKSLQLSSTHVLFDLTCVSTALISCTYLVVTRWSLAAVVIWLSSAQLQIDCFYSLQLFL